MNKNHLILVTTTLILILLALFFLPVKVPYAIESVAKMLPAHRWILSRGNDGEILSNTENFLSGINNSYQRTSFERGESLILNLNSTLNNGDIVSKGDTLGLIYSSGQQENLIQLNGDLQVLNASLKASMSGDKNTEVREAQQRLAMAQSELNKQTKIVKRQKELLKKDIVAMEVYETAADELKILEKAVNVRQAEVESALSGKKDEEINQLKENIVAIENRISFLQQQVDSQNLIIAPFSGRIDRTFSNDTLLVVSNFDSGIACIPVPLEEADFIPKGGNVSFNSSNLGSQFSGEVQMKQPVMQLIGGKQCIIVLATFNPLSNDFISGLLAPVKINCGSISLPAYLKRNILN